MNDAELAAENARRYTEWHELLRDVVRPLTRNAIESKREVVHLIALVDGLGLRMARHTETGSALAPQQRECKATLIRHLTRFEAD